MNCQQRRYNPTLLPCLILWYNGLCSFVLPAVCFSVVMWNMFLSLPQLNWFGFDIVFPPPPPPLLAGNIYKAHDNLFGSRYFLQWHYFVSFIMLFAFYNNNTLPSTDGSVINIVVGGEVVTLRSMEESLGLIVAEVPINVSLLSLQALLSLDWKT